MFRIGRSVPPSLGLGLVATLLLSIGSWEAQAQEGPPGRLTGRVVDASSGDPLPAATVALWTRADGDSTLVTGTVTGLKGRFEITDAPSQSYVLRISYVGYQTLRRANIRAKLAGGLQLELSQFYRPARDIPPQGRIDRFTSTELALQQELFGGDGNLTLRVDDLFNDTDMNMWYRDQQIYQQSTSQWGAREVSLSFQYTFGAGESQDRGRDDYGRYR